MNIIPSISLLAQATESAAGLQDASSSLIFASVAIVISAIIGLLAGFFLGSKYGRMSGELRMLKSMKSDRSRKHRPRSGERTSDMEQEAVH